MGYHDFKLLHLTIELDGIRALFVAARAGLLLLVWPLHGVLLRALLEYFAILCRVPRDMQQACISRTGRPIDQMACMICLALAGAALLGVGW